MRQAVYSEAVAMAEEYQHATAAGSAGAGKKLNCSSQVGSTCHILRKCGLTWLMKYEMFTANSIYLSR